MPEAERCLPTCGRDDPHGRWDEPARRRAIRPRGRWPTLGFERLEPLTLSDLVEVHYVAASYGYTTGKGPQKHHYLDAIWEGYLQNVRDRIDPVYTATRFVKHTVMHRPWRDANRRTSFLWASTHFTAFGLLVRIGTPEAIRFKTTVRNQTFGEVYAWFQNELEKGPLVDDPLSDPWP